MAALGPRRCNAPALPYPDFDAHPSEQDLITSFLRPRVALGDAPGAFIHDADVYSAHPARLTEAYAPALGSNGDKAWYFFSAVRPKGGGRKARTVDSGDGCWHSEAGAKPIFAAPAGGRHCVGYRQSFSFATKEEGRVVRSGWLMVELGLDGDGQGKLSLCKVYWSPRANKQQPPAAAGRKRKAAAAADDDDDAPADETRHRRRRRACPSPSPIDAAEPPESETTTGDAAAEEKTAVFAGAVPMGYFTYLMMADELTPTELDLAADDWSELAAEKYPMEEEDALSDQWILRHKSWLMEKLGIKEEEFERARLEKSRLLYPDRPGFHGLSSLCRFIVTRYERYMGISIF